jgi:hypothetical protein
MRPEMKKVMLEVAKKNSLCRLDRSGDLFHWDRT